MGGWHEAVKAYRELLGDKLDDLGYPQEAYYFGTILQEIFLTREEAARWYKAVVDKQPHHAEAWLQLALLYQEMADQGGKSGIEAHSRLPVTLARATKVLQAKLGGVDKADVLYKLGSLHLGTGDLIQADERLREAETYCKPREPLMADIRWKRGVLQSRWKNYEKSLEYLQTAARLRRDSLKLKADLGEVYLKLERSADAETEYIKVLKLAPENVEALIGLAQVYIELAEQGDADYFVKAEQHLSSAIKHGTDETGSKRLAGSELGQLYYLHGYILVKLFETDLKSKAWWSNAWRLFSAERDIRKCVQYDPEHIKAAQALEKLKTGRQQQLWRPLELLGPLLLCVLATIVFTLAQISFFFPDARVFGAGLKSALSDSPGYYALTTFGALTFFIAGLYLPQILKLKVGAITLEKASVEQIAAPLSLGLKR
jgi:tetratricopeptide (TPR) repeat protein